MKTCTVRHDVTCQVLVLVPGEDRFSCDVGTVNGDSDHAGGANVGGEGDVPVECVAATQRHVGGEGDSCQHRDSYRGLKTRQEGLSRPIQQVPLVLLYPDHPTPPLSRNSSPSPFSRFVKVGTNFSKPANA